MDEQNINEPEETPREAMSREDYLEKFKKGAHEFIDTVDEKVDDVTKERAKTFFVRNNKKVLRWAAICGVGITFQVLRHKNKTLGAKVELLNIENEFLHFVISGISNPDVDETEFSKEIARRANYTQIVGKL